MDIYCYFCALLTLPIDVMFLYTDFSTFLKKYFEFKVQKLSVNAGFSCPTRNGYIGYGGCTYCNNQSFNPDYCTGNRSVKEQLEDGKMFFSRKYPEMKYLAYFQAYTNTYEKIEILKRLYEEALAVENVVGLVIGTRPDCVSEDLLGYLSELGRHTFVLLEYGVETTDDALLERINRGHTFDCAAKAICLTARYGLHVGAHLILGLPGQAAEQMVEQADILSDLPLETLKLHQLQLVRGTVMAREYERYPSDFNFLSVDEYADLVIGFLERLRPDIVVERFTSQTPKELLIAPDWGLKNYEFVALIQRRLKERCTYQGRLWKGRMD